MARPSRPLARTLPLAARTIPLRPLVAATKTVNGRRPAMTAAATPPESNRLLLDAAVDWALYIEGIRQEHQDFDAACAVARSGEGFIWLGLHEPTTNQLNQLGEVFDLHELALEDASNNKQRPKIERYDDMLFLALRSLAYIDRDDRIGEGLDGGDIVETGTVMVFLGEYYAVTVRHGRHASMRGLRRRLEQDPEQLALGPSAVLHAVCDKVVDDYLAVVDQVNEDIEEIETSVFTQRRITDVERIYQLKRDIIEMKRTVSPLAGPLHELAHRAQGLVHPDIREYFRDVEDHLIRVREQVQSYDELLGSILQAGLARLTVSENEDMRKISAWVAIAAVPTMIAGVYGMNFDYIPLLHNQWGYPIVSLVMLTICGTLFRGFRRNGWL
ncbi:MAG: magnesium and cobalt transport protein CorA [Kineosporiaceae bacterium]|nr:magnesium and cobalt transport protein CorA [Kineosporiaceae bacterium]MBK7622649.1 magnesium and cobalt transport protein CorA [Kineosporiaceae bacterium]MBK8078629.1 magnesium and cobalt transport protein CorA [Kineosporiaceae bacterium]